MQGEAGAERRVRGRSEVGPVAGPGAAIAVASGLSTYPQLEAVLHSHVEKGGGLAVEPDESEPFVFYASLTAFMR